ncbi:MAG TPA: hypothetical protein VH105_21715 [Burkholderiales bacterium]|jgi:hypothetical protein|nr:hypothetical protein [Burkholderiales bacterium]
MPASLSTNTIDHATLSDLVQSGSVTAAEVVGRAGGWCVVVRHGRARRMLASQRSHGARTFRRLETLVAYLKNIGIDRFEVDAANYGGEAKSGPGRTDVSKRMKQAHEAASYDRWFRAEVERAIAEADDPTAVWVSHDEVKARFAKRRAELLKRVGKGKPV